MKIEELELVGYIRLSLANIHKFIYKPTLSYQLILGTNGSGKSSILAELSPLPGAADAFTKDGYKYAKITHNGSIYEVRSTFAHGGAGKHTFIKDGETLNDNGTAMVQKQLCEREFKYTPELHDVLTGAVKFTSMQGNQRREWITKLSVADYSYALGRFKLFKTKERDAEGALKYLRKKLMETTQALKGLGDMDGLDERAEQLRAELNVLLTSRVPNLPAFDQCRNRLQILLQELDTLSRQVTTSTIRRPEGTGYQSLADVAAHLNETETTVSTTQVLLNRYTTEYSDLDSILTSLQQSGESIPENIEGAIFELEGTIQDLTSQLSQFRDLAGATEIQRETEQIIDNVLELWGLLPDNTDRKWSREHMDRAAANRQQLEQAISTSQVKMSQIAARLETIEKSKDTSCPSCGYVWREGFSHQEVDLLKQQSQDHQGAIDKARGEIAELNTYLGEAEEVSALYTRFRGFVSGYPRLRPFWDHLLANKCLTDNPQSHRGLFFTWRKDVSVQAQIEEKTRRLHHLQDLSLKGEGGHVTQRLAKLRTEIETTTGSLQTLRTDLRAIRLYHDHLVRLEDSCQRLQTKLNELEQLEATSFDALRNQEIDQATRTEQNELAHIQRQLTEKQGLEGIINDLSSGLDDTELEHQAMKMIAEELSPTDGLIAEQLTGFIGVLVTQLNSIIASVWTYDLTVQACGLDSGELDYKFPVVVQGVRSKDVSKVSTAQTDIIDFAFVLTTMLYLDLQDYPLFLDELGASFDEAHRVNVMAFVKQLMDANRYSQAFMISHYASSHGALVNAEVLVLHGGNIAVPGEYNKHVVLA